MVTANAYQGSENDKVDKFFLIAVDAIQAEDRELLKHRPDNGLNGFPEVVIQFFIYRALLREEDFKEVSWEKRYSDSDQSKRADIVFRKGKDSKCYVEIKIWYNVKVIDEDFDKISERISGNDRGFLLLVGCGGYAKLS